MRSTVESDTKTAELALTLAQMELEKFLDLEREDQLRTAALNIDVSIG